VKTRLVTTNRLADLLDEIKTNVLRGETLEGTLRYSAPRRGFVEVFAAIRIGNDMGQGGVLLIEGEDIYVEGWTKAGRYVRIEGDPYGHEREKSRIFVDDGFIDRRDCHINRYRDGGSTEIELPDGKGHIFKPNRLGVEGPQIPTLDGEPLEPLEPIG
jgi:hypothetical protein